MPSHQFVRLRKLWIFTCNRQPMVSAWLIIASISCRPFFAREPAWSTCCSMLQCYQYANCKRNFKNFVWTGNGLFALVRSGTGTRTRTEKNGLYGFNKNLSHCTWKGTGKNTRTIFWSWKCSWWWVLSSIWKCSAQYRSWSLSRLRTNPVWMHHKWVVLPVPLFWWCTSARWPPCRAARRFPWSGRGW